MRVVSCPDKCEVGAALSWERGDPASEPGGAGGEWLGEDTDGAGDDDDDDGPGDGAGDDDGDGTGDGTGVVTGDGAGAALGGNPNMSVGSRTVEMP